MDLYKKIDVKDYMHFCFFQKMLIESQQARFLYLNYHLKEDFLRLSETDEVIDCYISNPDDFHILKDGHEYVACIVPLTKDGELKRSLSIIVPYDMEYYVDSIITQMRYTFHLIEGKTNIDDSSYSTPTEFEQLLYLLTYNHPMKDIEPCGVVREVMEIHERYINSDDIQIAYQYEEYLEKSERYHQSIARMAKDSHYLLVEGIQTIFELLEYNEDLSWLKECSCQQLERIFDFNWKTDKPSYHEIKKSLQEKCINQNYPPDVYLSKAKELAI